MWYNKYIGIPYKDGGRDENGLDCWGLVRLVYKEQYNIDLPSFTSHYSTAKDRELINELISRHKEGWEKTTEPVEGSVVLMRVLGTETHVGVYLGNNAMLHIREGVHAIIEPVDTTTWKNRIVGYYNYTEKFSESINVVAAPHPLKTETVTLPIFEGTKLDFIAEHIKSEYNISDKLYSKVIFLLNGKVIPQSEWHVTKVSRGDSLEYRAVPGDDSGIFRMVAFLVLAVTAPYLANGLIGGAGGFGASVFAGGLSATGIAAYAGVMIAGSALINAIAPIRPPQQGPTPEQSVAQNLITGAHNQALQYGAIPVVLGKMRVTPPLGATNNVRFSSDPDILSFSENTNSGGIAGKDTFVDMLLVWGYGPVALDVRTLKIGQVNIYNEDGTSNYTNFKQITLDRKTEPSADVLKAFNDIYGKDVQQFFPNQQLTYDGLPPVGSTGIFIKNLPWTPAPTRTDNLGWVEYAFSQPSTSVSVAIGFPQGLRAIIVNGNGAGKEKPAPVKLHLQIKRNSADSWHDWGIFTVGGKLSSTNSTSTVTEYTCDYEGVCYDTEYQVNTSDNEILGGGPIKDAFTWTVTKNRIDVTENIDANGNVTYSNPVTNWGENDLLQIRIRRLSGDKTEPNDNYRYSHQAVVQTVTSHSNSLPCIDPPNSKIAKTAITIQATDEINGQIDGINGLVQTVCKDWDSTLNQWVERATSNPASLFRYVLQHSANPQRVPDSQINLTQLQHWHSYCNQTRTVYYNNEVYQSTLQYNSILGGSQRSVLDVLRDIAAAGRASPAMLDGKWSVVIDEPKSDIIQHFTPHNSWGFEATKMLPRMPEALKVQFSDRDNDYVQKEVIVSYADKSPTSAQLLESIQLPGVTSTAEAIDHAKWHLAQIKLRPEVYVLNTDIEYIVCSRGDRVKVSHDVPMWGSGTARVTRTHESSPGSISVLQLDDLIAIDPTKNYNIRIRNSANGSSSVFNINKSFNISSLSRQNNIVSIFTNGIHPLNAGDTVTVSSSNVAVNGTITIDSVLYSSGNPIGFAYTLEGANIAQVSATGTISLTPNSYTAVQLSNPATTSNVAPDDLILFGEVSRESQDLIVTKIEPTSNKTARITMVDYGVTSSYNVFTDYANITSNAVFEALITEPPTELSLQVGNLIPIVNPAQVLSDGRVARRLSPGVYEYIIRVPYSNPPNLPNDVGFVMAEMIPANMPDTSGTVTFKADISLRSIDLTGVQEGQVYRFRLRYVTKSGKFGPWTNWFGHLVAGKNTNYYTVPGLALDLDTTYIVATTIAPNDSPDFKTYEFRLYKDTGVEDFWDIDPKTNGILVVQSRTSARFNLLDMPNPRISTEGITYRVACRAIDSSNNYSATSALGTIVVKTIQ